MREGKIRSLEEIYLYSLPIKEFEIIDHFLGSQLKDEVLKIMPVQKQTRAGQRTRFKAFVAIGDSNGHIGLGVKCSKEVATAIRGAIILAKLSVVPVRRGYWGNKIGKPHTVPCKVSANHYAIQLNNILYLLHVIHMMSICLFLCGLHRKALMTAIRCLIDLFGNLSFANAVNIVNLLKKSNRFGLFPHLVTGHRKVRFRISAFDSSSTRYWYRFSSNSQEIVVDGWY